MLKAINDALVSMLRRRRAVSKVADHFESTYGQRVLRRSCACRRYGTFCVVRVSYGETQSPLHAYFSVTDDGVIKELSLDEVKMKYGTDPWK